MNMDKREMVVFKSLKICGGLEFSVISYWAQHNKQNLNISQAALM